MTFESALALLFIAAWSAIITGWAITSYFKS